MFPVKILIDASTIEPIVSNFSVQIQRELLHAEMIGLIIQCSMKTFFTKLSERVDCISDITVVMAVSEIFNNPTWFKLASARHKEFTLCGFVAYVTEFHFQAHSHPQKEDQSEFHEVRLRWQHST